MEDAYPEIVVCKTKPEDTLDKTLDPWSREGLLGLYEAGLEVGKGLSFPPHIIPYRFLGTPDLKRDDSLLPKTFQYVERIKPPSSSSEKDVVQCIRGEPMVLPLTLRAACWNGERWEGTSQTASEAKRRNGFDALYSEVVKTEKRLILCKTGQYFLNGVYVPTQEDKRSPNVMPQFPERQHKRRASIAKPFIPPLPLKELPSFVETEELGHNEDILSAYREESHRYETTRLSLSANRTRQDNNVLQSGQTISGLPLKACGDTSLRQLGNILKTDIRFRSMQNHYNGKLQQSLRVIQTTRPYHYVHEFGVKQKGVWNPSSTPRRATTLRKHLVRFAWYEDLIKMVYLHGRYPSKSELFIIEDIRRVLDEGESYTSQRYTNLILELGKKKMDTESSCVQQTLLHVQNALKISDLEILTNLMLFKAEIPSWLQSKTTIVKQAIRNLSPQRFPMCNWIGENNKPKTSMSKLHKLLRVNGKYPSFESKSPLAYPALKQTLCIKS